jgi:hypothetical protein
MKLGFIVKVVTYVGTFNVRRRLRLRDILKFSNLMSKSHKIFSF